MNIPKKDASVQPIYDDLNGWYKPIYYLIRIHQEKYLIFNLFPPLFHCVNIYPQFFCFIYHLGGESPSIVFISFLTEIFRLNPLPPYNIHLKHYLFCFSSYQRYSYIRGRWYG